MNKPVSVTTLRQMKQSGEKIAVLTAYDASFASVLDEAGVDAVMVGDSLGMVVQGQDSTVPVTMDDMVYHTRLVRRGCKRALVIADLSFMSYATLDLALMNATRLMQAGAQVVKLEGGEAVVEVIQTLTALGVPVCAHLGLLPQSVNKLGGYRYQGKQSDEAQGLLREAKAIEDAGADMVVLECVPAELAKQISQSIAIPTIGIGAGAGTDGQVLVSYDMLGISAGHRPRFSHNFLTGQSEGITGAVAAYVKAVRNGSFPDADHTLA